jgi:hypothetical protein
MYGPALAGRQSFRRYRLLGAATVSAASRWISSPRAVKTNAFS